MDRQPILNRFQRPGRNCYGRASGIGRAIVEELCKEAPRYVYDWMRIGALFSRRTGWRPANVLFYRAMSRMKRCVMLPRRCQPEMGQARFWSIMPFRYCERLDATRAIGSARCRLGPIGYATMAQAVFEPMKRQAARPGEYLVHLRLRGAA